MIYEATKNETEKMTVETPLGLLVAQASSDPNYPGIYITLKRADGVEIDLMCAECQGITSDGICGIDKDENPDIGECTIGGYLWEDPRRESWTYKYTWEQKELLNQNI